MENKLNISIIGLLKETILKNKIIGHTYINIYGNTKYSLDDILNEIIYVLKTGVSWRQLRSSINYNTLFWHFNRFVKNNIFKSAYDNLYNYYLTKIKSINGIIIDSSFVQNKLGKNFPRNKYFKNKKCIKISLLTDLNKIPFSILLKNGNLHDATIFEFHKKDIQKYKKKFINNIYFLADKGYISKKIKNYCTENKINYLVPNKKNAKNKVIFNDAEKLLYRKRTQIERLFGNIKQFRRIQCVFESNLKSYLNFLYLALFILLYNNLKNNIYKNPS